MNVIPLVACAVAFVVGVSVIRANPARSINRAFGILSAAVCLWMLFSAELYPSNPRIVYWLRATNAAGALIPWALWILKETIRGEPLTGRVFIRSWPWGLVALSLILLCNTEYFIPLASTPAHPIEGWGRAVYSIVVGGEYLWLVVEAITQMRQASGMRREELRFLVLGGTTAGICGWVVTVAAPELDVPELRRGLPLVLVLFYVLVAWAITTRKVFDARQLLRSAMAKASGIGAIALVCAVVLWMGRQWKWPLVVVVATQTIGIAVALERVVRWNAKRGASERDARTARQRMLVLSRESREWPELEEGFCEALSAWAGTERAYILGGSADEPGRVERLPALPPGAEAELQMDGWASPEKLQRELMEPERSELAEYLRVNRLGLLVSAAGAVGAVPVAVALAERGDGRPYTFSDVQQMREWATIVESCVWRTVLMQQARDAEQLATAGLLGASLAHEIRNPLVAIKSIVFLARDRYAEPDFRRILCDVVPGEISRIETLVTGLMELGKPRHPKMERLGLNEVVATSLNLVRAKAKDQDVKITEELMAAPDEVFADSGALRQVVINLVMNAIDAVAEQPAGSRWVKVATAQSGQVTRIEVSDSGPGVPEAARRTLFRPFTKSAKSVGMGLGLAICADIVRAHRGTIELVDIPTQGACFRVELPAA